VTDGQTELRWLRRAIAVPAVTRKNKNKATGDACQRLHLLFLTEQNMALKTCRGLHMLNTKQNVFIYSSVFHFFYYFFYRTRVSAQI